MHGDSLGSRHSAGITIVYLVKIFHTRVVESAVPQKPWVGFGGRAEELSKALTQLVDALYELRGRPMRQ